MPYKLLEDVAVADIAFQVTGKDLDELFHSVAQAFIDITVNTKTVNPQKRHHISLQETSVERLLFAFLEELVYVRDAEYLVFSSCVVTVQQQNKKYVLEAILQAESIDTEKHELRMDVKAVTMHRFKVEQTKDGWKAEVVLDI